MSRLADQAEAYLRQQSIVVRNTMSQIKGISDQISREVDNHLKQQTKTKNNPHTH